MKEIHLPISATQQLQQLLKKIIFKCKLPVIEGAFDGREVVGEVEGSFVGSVVGLHEGKEDGRRVGAAVINTSQNKIK
jgi:hypothetical protein